VDLLLARAELLAEKTAYTFLGDGENEQATWSYRQLDARARTVGSHLQSLKAKGERVLLLYPPGLEFVAGFWGCLYAGAIPVPLYPPRLNRSISRLRLIAEDCTATIALTTRQGLLRMQPRALEGDQLPCSVCMSTDDLPETDGLAWRRPDLSGVSPALLQYTSGSTSSAKGVMITHSNLLENEKQIKRAFRQDENSVIVGWLPLYHDMGLIGNMLQPLYLGAECVLMPPTAFLQQPARWLSAISRYKGTTSGGPNMAYDLCVRRITEEELSGLDLSSWCVAFNGAEPVRARTIRSFAARFSAVGFSERAFSACYGLAEATLLISSASVQGEPSEVNLDREMLGSGMVRQVPMSKASATLVGCGRPPQETDVVIVHPDSKHRCVADQVGEIWASGPSIAQGYWNRPEQTEQSFFAKLDGEGEKPFLRTGDLGFIADGQLFVTGRLKDLIIIRGRNHYPQDIELSVESAHEALRPGCGAAFSVEEQDEEHLVVVQEVAGRFSGSPEELVRSIRRALSREHEIQAHAIVLVRPFSVPKTSSGKVQRLACRKQYLEGLLDVRYEWKTVPSYAHQSHTAAEPETSIHNVADVAVIEQWLVSKLAASTGVAVYGIDHKQPVSSFGLDSLAAVEMEHALEREFGASIAAVRFLQEFSIEQLAAEIVKRPVHQKTDEVKPQLEAQEFQLSQGQRSLWFLQQLAPAGTAYNLSFAARVPGLQVRAFHSACEHLVQRHGSLRASFPTVNGRPSQRVQPIPYPSFEEIDASSWDEPLLNQRLEQEANVRFSLSDGGLFRVRVFQRNSADALILLVVHHIIADFWSLALLVDELTLLYRAEVAGQPLRLPPLLSHYGDFVHWQNELLASEAEVELYRYWEAQLSDGSQILNLPTDLPRPALQKFAGASRNFRINSKLTAGLRMLSKSNTCTLYATLMAAFQVLLMRYSGQKEFLVGSPVAGRDKSEWARVVGHFVNTVAVRATLIGNPSFTQLLKHVKATTLDALEHQNYPFSTLVEKLQPVRNLSYSPVVQVMFAFEKTIVLQQEGIGACALGDAGTRVVFNGVPLEMVELKSQSSMFDLTLMIAEVDDSLSAAFQYNVDLFEDSTIERLSGYFERLLEGIVEDPGCRVDELEMLSAGEREEMVTVWNQAQLGSIGERSLLDLFERQAERSPDQIALVCGGEEFSYAALNERSNQLGHYLRKQGVGPECLVGICMERDVDMMVGLLGILKVGGAYVPLDPGYPQERLRFMMEDTQTRVVVTKVKLLSVLPAGVTGRIVCLDLEREAISREPRENLGVKIEGENLAYLIYTSGSTGRAKAVMIRHRSAVVLCHWARELYGDEELGGVLASTSICFDLSVFELFVPLSWGGRVILVDNVLALSTLGAEADVRLINTVPSAMSELLRMGELPASVQVVNLAGEALGRDLVQRLYGRKHVGKVYNLYGPSEDTTYSTWGLVGRSEQSPSIGRPIANTQVYVLDENMQPVAVGVHGEIYLGGEGVGRGYLGRPELTAEKFVPDGFSAHTGARLYRTGDLGRYRANGELEYLGRMDAQVKIRGYRIELGEIEAVLCGCAGVRDAAAAAREDVAGDKRLVGYVVLQEGWTTDRVKTHLRQSLPEYLVPGVLVRLEKLPLTPNGKLDRKALPAPEYESVQEYAAPRTGTEEVLAQLWAEVLHLKLVGVQDNFFDLGGHSLLAAQLIARVNDSFGIRLLLHEVFDQPTVEAMAKSVEREMGTGVLEVEKPLIRRITSAASSQLSFGQQRLWFLDQLQPQSAFYNLPAAVLLEGDFDLSAFQWSLQQVIARHEILRTRFESGLDGEPQQVVELELSFRIPVVQVSGDDDQQRWAEVYRLASQDAQQPFDLRAGPLLRVQILTLTARQHVALFTLHHIISDGWSHKILQEELTAHYAQRVTGRPADLRELDIQYADYAAWQHEWLDQETMETHLAYWRSQLGDMTGVLELPADHARPAIQTHRGAHRPFAITPGLAARLEETARRENVTLFMLLLSGFQALLSRYSRQRDVAVGVPVANRLRQETEKLIGFFANTLILRTQIDPTRNVRELLRAVRKTALEAYAYQEFPFEKLVQALNPPRDLSRSPLFQVMFAFQDTSSTAFELPGLIVREIQVENHISKFDLFLDVARIQGGGLRGTWEYNVDLFEDSTIERLSGYFERLLEGIVEDPGCRVDELEMLSAGEREEMVTVWNQAQLGSIGERSLLDLFERQAERSPDQIALVCGGEEFSYAALNERSNQLGHYLRKQGVGPECLVGICMERDVDMMVGLLGILKVGGAYVPLDPGYPQERLRFMMEDTQTRVVVTKVKLLSVLPAGVTGRIVCLDLEREAISREPRENLGVKIEGENLAYLIYTSGSTGRAKAVMIRHRSAVVLCHWARELYGDEELGGVLASTSICFDLSVFELFVPLSWGGRVILVDNVLALSTLGAEADVRLINTVPSAMSELLRMGELPASVQVVNLAGEALGRDLVQRLYGRKHVGKVYNLYGPSEDTTYSTWGLVGRSEQSPSIGRPIANTQVYVLDENMQPVAVGVHGEIYLGGEGVGRGYLGRPELTAEKFVPDGFSAHTGARLYRTGDLGRYRANGELEYLGRMDAQVKIRGYRIELGEIEAVLCGCAGVRDAAAAAREDVAGDKRLVGYVVLQEGWTTDRVKTHLRQSLPEYLVPGVLVRLEKLPLTPNGKLDRKALPAPEYESVQEYAAPRTGTEEVLAQLWAEVLHLKLVGVQDNFFDLGGHSLLAAQLIARVKQVFPIDLNVRSLFEAPTVEAMARRVDNAIPTEQSTIELVPIARDAHRMRIAQGDSSASPASMQPS
jgi:amino acid adenylation domain-containing protein